MKRPKGAGEVTINLDAVEASIVAKWLQEKDVSVAEAVRTVTVKHRKPFKTLAADLKKLRSK
jgi:hypothetical protein